MPRLRKFSMEKSKGKISILPQSWLTVDFQWSVTHFNLLRPSSHLMHHQFNIQQLYALPALYLCFVFIWEQTATCATYSINWLVFITQMKSVYSAVRTGSLNKAVCASSLNILKFYTDKKRAYCHNQGLKFQPNFM